MLRPFEYLRPKTIDEAVAALQEENTAVLAGGTDLLVKIRAGNLAPRLVVDLKDLSELKGIRVIEGEKLWIGALTTMKELTLHPLIQSRYKALAEAASVMGCYEIRVRATIGGNICNASPGAETGPVLSVYDARVQIYGPKGSHILPLEQFTLGPGRVALEKGEILGGFILPPLPAGADATYLRRGRIKGMDLATIGVAVFVGRKGDNGGREVRVAAGAVLPTPSRVEPVEEILSRGPLTRELVQEAQNAFAMAISPRATSIRATPEYKKQMAGVLLEMALARLTVLEYSLEEVAFL